MKFTRTEVFEIVDALFHKYASNHRNDAKEELADIIQRREDVYKQENISDANLECHHRGDKNCIFCNKQLRR
jgi:hypothetical protein